MDDDGEKLARIVTAWASLARGDLRELEVILDERVTWQGVRPELVCHDRAEVMGLLGRRRGRPLRITRLEAEEDADRVAISVEGPDFVASDAEPIAGPRSLVFTFREGRVVRMESFPSRDEAFAALERAAARPEPSAPG